MKKKKKQSLSFDEFLLGKVFKQMRVEKACKSKDEREKGKEKETKCLIINVFQRCLGRFFLFVFFTAFDLSSKCCIIKITFGI